MFRGLPKNVRLVGWFLFASYCLSSIAFAVAEFRYQLLSELFGYPPEFVYLTKVIQLVCSVLLLSEAFVLWAIFVLTVTSLGAIVSYLKIQSVFPGLPALGFTVLQIWFGLKVYWANHGNDHQ